MRNNILNIIKKEFDRFFKDKRMVFTAIIMPAVLIYALYSIMGAGISSSETVDDDYVSKCYVQNMPESFSPIFEAIEFKVTDITDTKKAKSEVEEKNMDLFVVFPTDFDTKIMQMDPVAEVPNVEVYYNSTSKESAATYSVFMAATEQFESSLANVFDINKGIENSDLATESDKTSSLVASILPMMLVMLLFTGCIAVAPESIAGEKERGTIATLLVTPVSRTDIAIGKIISLSLFALLAGVSSFVGVMLALPKMFGSELEEFSMNMYGVSEYVCLLCIIVSTVLLIVSIISVVSAYSKSVKEATSMTSPLMMISTLTGIIPMFSVDFSNIGWRFIPIFNSVLSLNDIFLLEYSSTNVAVTCISNIVYMFIFVVVLSRMFNSEAIMFKK